MISINFASKNYGLIERLQLGLTAFAVLLLSAAAIIIWNGISLRIEAALMDKKIGDLQAGEAQVRPLLAERDLLLKDLSAMSVLTESRRFSWTMFLTDIERIFPVGVALDKIEYNPRDRSLALEGAALSPESLRNLMVGLERTSAFKEPYLRHQSVDKGSISFNVVAFYSEHKAAPAIQGK